VIGKIHGGAVSMNTGARMQALKKQSLTEDGLEFVTDQPEPSIGHAEVKIRVEAASICGTDQSIYQITSIPGMRDEMLTYNGGDVSRYQPIIVGHEFCGEVVEVREDVSVDPSARRGHWPLNVAKKAMGQEQHRFQLCSFLA
jgi:threonine dehydrogenase-like Zn-dependent dehydrogenase